MRFWVWAFVIAGLLGSGCVRSNKKDYEDTANDLFLKVWNKYRMPEYGLFFEYFPQDHKPEMFYFQDSVKSAQEVAFLWPMSGVFSATNVLMELDSVHYLPYLDSMVYAVDQYYDASRRPAGYQAYPTALNHADRYYDDNGLVGIDYIDAFEVTGNSDYLIKAKEVMEFIRSGWSEDYGGGISWLEGVRDQKPACSNGKATVLALKLFQAASESAYLDYGLASYNWMMDQLRDDSLNIMWNSLLTSEKEPGVVQKHAYTYNTGVMIQSAVRLYKITGEKDFLDDAQSLAEGSYNYYVHYTEQGVPYIEDLPWFVVVLFRGYHELFEVDNNSKYIHAIMNAADYALDNAIDSDGLFFHDWTGRSGEKGQPKWLLDEACMVELFARIALIRKGVDDSYED
ncbi:glycoside hydrolase family 76 protein [Marinilabilia salmonicolor]|uniref:glycoside hydrolase family 76 protein n=1 Tax=Marinilabilia salmonicolor TaxID=989 RepID=UPI00029A405D|nr:glycoside hydrolase family 76 protein [Marinilabilia salmonicolor]